MNWKSLEREEVALVLKDRFGFQRAYHYLGLLDMSEPHVSATKDFVVAESCGKGEKLYCLFNKNDFAYNVYTGSSAWDNVYDQERFDHKQLEVSELSERDRKCVTEECEATTNPILALVLRKKCSHLASFCSARRSRFVTGRKCLVRFGPNYA